MTDNDKLKPAWVCEFCFACLLDGNLPEDWALVWQSAVCPSCQIKVKRDGGYFFVNGGAYADDRTDPRAMTPVQPSEKKKASGINYWDDFCPTCGEPCIAACRCPKNDRKCKNEHWWRREYGSGRAIILDGPHGQEVKVDDV